MQKILISLIITFLSLIGNNCFAQTFGGGDGSAGNPYQISTVAHLTTLATNVNAGTTYSGVYFVLISDIDISGSFTPIGKVTTSNNNGSISNPYPFKGNFNGNNFTIRRLKISSTPPLKIGLFGCTDSAFIENVSMKVDTISINGNQDYNYTGFLIAYANNTIVRNCNIGDSTHIYYGALKKDNNIGGMIGYAYNCTIELCYSLCSISIIATGDQNNNSIGGLIGKAVNCTINNCYTRNYLWTNSQNNNSNIGGLVGTTQNSTFSNSYSAPNSFSSNFFRGVIVPNNISTDTTTFDNCYYLIDTVLIDADSDVGTGLTIDQMQDDSFIDSLNNGQSPPIWDSDGGLPTIFPPIIWPGGGEGTELDPFRIKYVIDLINMSEITKIRSFRGYFLRLENDINFNNGVADSSNLFNPIGNIHMNKPFRGNLNGNMYAISNISFSNLDSNNIGVFGYTRNAIIKKLGISNINIIAKDTVGALVAIVDYNNLIDSCFVYGHINGENCIGGLVGVSLSPFSKITNSFTNLTVDAKTNVGGIAGSYKGLIANSYSNSEIYSSTIPNNYVGGIIGFATDTTTIINVYSASKIIRNGNNTNFGKIVGNNLVANTNSYSRDSVFVNYTNITPSGFNGIQKSNFDLRGSSFVTDLNNSIWRSDYSNNINDGYPILSYQPQALIPNSSGAWNNGTASQVVIIQDGVQLKIDTSSSPKCAYIKIEDGGELYNNTTLNFFGESKKELYAGKWNLIGLSTYNQSFASLINFADTSFRFFVKEFDYSTNNWSTTTIQDINTQFKYGEGILVMPNYSLDASLIIKSRIVSKGVLFNDNNLSYFYNNTSTVTNKFVSLANNYPASLSVSSFVNDNISNIPEEEVRPGVQGRLIYVYDSDRGEWDNNYQTSNPITSIKPSEGFFVSPVNASGTFSLSKSQIQTSSAKNSIKSDLIYVYANSNDIQRESFLEFNEEADNAFDFEDGLMLFGSNYNSVEPFFTIPTPEINDSTLHLIKDAFSTLPYTTELDLRSQKNNEVSLNFSNIPSSIHVYLIDSLLNQAQYLNEEPNYNLQVNAGDNAKRFYVMFSYFKEDINEFFKPEPSEEIKLWNYNNDLNIEGKDLIKYEILDVIGNKLFEQEIQGDKFETQLDLNDGIYIIRAFSNTSNKVIKIILKN